MTPDPRSTDPRVRRWSSDAPAIGDWRTDPDGQWVIWNDVKPLLAALAVLRHSLAEARIAAPEVTRTDPLQLSETAGDAPPRLRDYLRGILALFAFAAVAGSIVGTFIAFAKLIAGLVHG